MNPDSDHRVNHKPIVVAGFGDSIMRGWRTGLCARETFRAQLEADLAAQGLNVVITDAAQPGNTVFGGLQRFERDVLGPQPAAVLLGFGANDSSPPANPRVSLSTYREVLEYMLDVLARRKSPCLLLAPPKLATLDAADRNTRLLHYVETLRIIAEERHLPLVDLFQAFTQAESGGTDLRDLYLDGLHFNARGHRFAADVILGFERNTAFFHHLADEPGMGST